MTTSGAAELLRGPGDPQRATFLELFFDLAFVFALAQLSHELIDDLTWIGVLQTLVLLLAIWQIWFSTAATTDRLDPRRPAIQLLVIATMVGSLVVAAALPDAFGETGLIFAGVYVGIQVWPQPLPRGRTAWPRTAAHHLADTLLVRRVRGPVDLGSAR